MSYVPNWHSRRIRIHPRATMQAVGEPRIDQDRFMSVGEKILALSPVAYWPLNEAAGAAAAIDVIGGANSTTETNVTFGVEGVGDSNTAARIGNAVNDGFIMPHETLAATFPKDEGTFLAWIKLAADAWTDSTLHTIASFGGDGTANFYLEKSTGNLLRFHRRGGSTTLRVDTSQNSSKWLLYAQTWSVSDNALTAYVDGVQVGSTQANVLGWGAVTLSSAYIGRQPGGKGLGGDMAHAALFSRALTAVELADLAILYGDSWTATLPQNLGGTLPAVLLMFDDGYTSTYSKAFAYCEARKVPATVYMITNNIGAGGSLTAAQLQTMNAAGWDIGQHSTDGNGLTLAPQATVEAKLSAARAALDALGLTRASRHVSYPGGDYDATVAAGMAAVGMLTGRTTVSTQYTLPPANNYQLSGDQILHTTSLATAKAKIDTAVTNGTICSLVFHDIVDADAGAYQWLMSDFQALVEHIFAKHITPLTISQVYDVQAGAVTVATPWPR